MQTQRVHFIAKRSQRDIFGIPVLSFFFKNKYMLSFYRLTTLFLLVYAIIYGILNPTKENIFTTAVFWSIFWPFLMAITLPTLGNVFCMVCPHGFLGKHITKFGLKLRVPRWLANPYIGLIGFNILAYWFIEYYHKIVNGFSQAFGLGIHAEPLAKRGNHWLHIFRIFPFVAGFWSMHILWRRTEFIGKDRRLSVFLVSSTLPVVHLLLTLFSLIAMLFFPAQHLHRH